MKWNFTNGQKKKEPGQDLDSKMPHQLVFAVPKLSVTLVLSWPLGHIGHSTKSRERCCWETKM